MAIANKYPTIRPSLNLDFATSKTIDPRITFSRASSATYFDDKGVMRTAPAGVPRIDFDPVTGECKGLLIEEQRTNLLLNSEAWTTGGFAAGWSVSAGFFRSMVAGDHPNHPGKTVCFFGPNSGVYGFNNANNNQVISSLGAAGTYVAYADYKAIGDTNTVRFLHVPDDGGSGTVGGVFYLTGGGGLCNDNFVAGDSFSAQLDSGSIPLGNGWYRVFVVFSTSRSIGQFRFRAFPYISKTPVFGDGVSGLHGTMAQLEVGAFPTSYIKTEASQVTRAADSAVMTGTNFSSWVNTTGSILAKYKTAGWKHNNTPPVTPLDLTKSVDDYSTSMLGDNLQRLMFYPRQLTESQIAALKG